MGSQAFSNIKKKLAMNLENELEAERVKADRVKHMQDRQLLKCIQEMKAHYGDSQQQDGQHQDQSVFQQQREYDAPTYTSPQCTPQPEHFVPERFRYPGGMDYSNGGHSSCSSEDDDSVCSFTTSKSTISTRNLERRSRRQRREQLLKAAYPRR